MSQTQQQKAKTNEWHTPLCYIQAAREVFEGAIDLDPASSALANETVQAKRYYTVDDNGLSKEWRASTMWLNPPYGKAIPYTSHGRYMGGGNTTVKSLQTQFVEKALYACHTGAVEQLILLVTANLTVRWFQPLYAYPVCIPYPKITFRVAGASAGQRQVFGNALVYLGPDEQRFISVFQAFGPVVKRVSPPVAG